RIAGDERGIEVRRSGSMRIDQARSPVLDRLQRGRETQSIHGPRGEPRLRWIDGRLIGPDIVAVHHGDIVPALQELWNETLEVPFGAAGDFALPARKHDPHRPRLPPLLSPAASMTRSRTPSSCDTGCCARR